MFWKILWPLKSFNIDCWSVSWPTTVKINMENRFHCNNGNQNNWYFCVIINTRASPWHKQLDALLAPLGFQVRVSVTPCGFCDGRNVIWVGFLGVSPAFSYHKFHSTISPHWHNFFSFHPPLWWCVRHGRFARWIKWRAYDAGEAKEGLENELWRRWSNGKAGEWAVS